MLSAHYSHWAEYSFTLWPFMLQRQCERPLAAANATGGPFAVSDRSEVGWVQPGIGPIFLAVLSTSQEQADTGVVLAGKLNYL